MPRILSRLFLCLGVACAAPAGTAVMAKDDPQVMTFGIVPQQSASRLAKMWGPFLAELGERTGVRFQFKTTKNIPTFEACLAAGAYDVAYMNPMHYAIFSEESGYQAIAKQASKQLKGVLVARADDGVTDINELDAATVAFPSPGAFGASILTRAALGNMGVSFTPSYVSSHDSVYRAVAAGLMPAGGGVLRTYNSVAPEIREQLQIIYETEGYTPHAIAVQGDLSEDLQTRIQSAMLEMSEASADLIRGIGMQGLEAGTDTDWDDVRNLGMSREDTGITQADDNACPSG